MTWFPFIRKRKKFKHEMMMIEEEINRSKRFGFHFAILVVEVSHSVPMGLSRVLPGKTLSFHILKKNLRLYDKVIDFSYRRYHVILPQADRRGADAVKERVLRLAQAYSWGDIMIGIAVYPEDGATSNLLLTKAADVIPLKAEVSNKENIQLTEDDRVRP